MTDGALTGRATAPPSTTQRDVMLGSGWVASDGDEPMGYARDVVASAGGTSRAESSEFVPTPVSRVLVTPVSRSSSRIAILAAASRATAPVMPGTQFSKVKTLWRKREGTAQRRSPSRTLSRQASILQSSLQNIESKVQTLAKDSAAALEDTRTVSVRALESVQAELAHLKTGQTQQASNVAALQTEVRRVSHDATERTVATDLQARTRQATQTMAVRAADEAAGGKDDGGCEAVTG